MHQGVKLLLKYTQLSLINANSAVLKPDIIQYSNILWNYWRYAALVQIFWMFLFVTFAYNHTLCD